MVVVRGRRRDSLVLWRLRILSRTLANVMLPAIKLSVRCVLFQCVDEILRSVAEFRGFADLYIELASNSCVVSSAKLYVH